MTSRKCCLLSGLFFWMDEVLNICIGARNQTEFLCQFIKHYLYSVSVSAFCLLLHHGCTWTEHTRNLRQRGASRHTVSNELCTEALSGSCCCRIRIIDHKEASLPVTYTHLYRLIQVLMLLSMNVFFRLHRARRGKLLKNLLQKTVRNQLRKQRLMLMWSL